MHVCLGVPSYPIPHEDRFTCYVLNTMLGGGMSSRLFQNIRERQGLAYAVFSELNPYSDTGCLSVYAGTSLESAKQVVESVLKEFTDLKQQRAAGGRSAPREGSSEGFADAESGIDFEPHVESGAAGDALPALLHAGRTGGEHRTGDGRRMCSASRRHFFDQKHVALTVLGNLDGFKIGREDLLC